jgi:hypothetical protein
MTAVLKISLALTESARRANHQISVQPHSQKYSGSLLTQITFTSIAVPSSLGGRIAIVTDVGYGMRWTQSALLTRAWFCGRQSRVVLTPRRWCQVLEKQASCKFLEGDGGKKARSPGRARNKPLKPLRREGGCSGEPVVTHSCAFYLCARGCGCNGHPAFPAPPVL